MIAVISATITGHVINDAGEYLDKNTKLYRRGFSYIKHSITNIKHRMEKHDDGVDLSATADWSNLIGQVDWSKLLDTVLFTGFFWTAETRLSELVVELRDCRVEELGEAGGEYVHGRCGGEWLVIVRPLCDERGAEGASASLGLDAPAAVKGWVLP